ncbi:MAG: acyltransferase [Actinomycetota bacterium]
MNTDGRIASLDGLRALAILLVVVSHLLSNFTSQLPYLGNLGVKVFFVISGFLITSILVAEFEKTDTINLKKFYFRRTLRIFPAYYFYIFIILLGKILSIYKLKVVLIRPANDKLF